MRREDAIELIGWLSGVTTGWNDDSVELYVLEVEKWTDLTSATEAIERVGRTWEEMRRPPLPYLIEQYRSAVYRAESARPRLAGPPPVPLPDGLRIAQEAYNKERAARGLPARVMPLFPDPEDAP